MQRQKKFSIFYLSLQHLGNELVRLQVLRVLRRGQALRPEEFRLPAVGHRHCLPGQHRLVEKPLEFEPQTSWLQAMCSTTVLTIAALPSHLKGPIHSKTTILLKVT